MPAPTATLTLVPPAPRAPSPLVLAVEVGGTTMRLAVARGARTSEVLRVPTPNYLDATQATAAALLDALLQRVVAAASSLGAVQPDVIVMAWPGPVAGGVALRSPTILGVHLDRQFDVRAALETQFPRARVHVLNDLTAAGYYFAGQDIDDFCIVTVGSGIGNKVFLGGEPRVGAQCLGGEIGHLRVRPAPGTPFSEELAELGSLASGRGMLWLAGRNKVGAGNLRDQPVTDEASANFVTAFRAGDEGALAVASASSHPLAMTLGALHLGLGLSRFIIVGGFAKALGETYRALLAALCRELTWDVGQDWDRMISLGPPDVEEGLEGALRYGARSCGAVLEC